MRDKGQISTTRQEHCASRKLVVGKSGDEKTHTCLSASSWH